MDELLHEFQSKKVEGMGDASPLSKKVGGSGPPASPPHYTPVTKLSTRAAVHIYSSSRTPFREPELSSVQFSSCAVNELERSARELSAADRRRGCK